MNRALPWLILGSSAAVFASSSFGCGGKVNGGAGGGTAGTAGSVEGGTVAGGGMGGGGTGGIDGGGAGGGIGGIGGTGQTKLGQACATDTQCGPNTNLICETANDVDFGGEGVAKGICTMACTQDSECVPVGDANAACLITAADGSSGYCVEGCTFGPADATSLDPKKCHGRPEVACALRNESNTTYGACVPQCNKDTDCGDTFQCDQATGLCLAIGPLTGAPVGMPCVQLGAGVSTCAGQCVGLVHGSGDAQPFTYVCVEKCTLGVGAVCGWGGPGAGPAPAACLFGPAVISSTAGPGDQGSCYQLCDCNADCSNPDLICSDFGNGTTSHQYGRKGYCADPLQADGGISAGITDCGTAGTG